jgi:YbbR domain-containing protein
MRIGDVWERITFQWPRKLAALGLGFLMWAFVTSTDTTIAQRSMLVPITVEGIAADLVPIGIPEVAEVTVSGPSQRLDRLRPEGVEAVLDLSGLAGDFSAPVIVAPPQGVVLERVNPAEVLGILERVATRQVPVTVVHLGTPPADVRFRSQPEPDAVTIRGRSARLDRVTQALVAIDARAEQSVAAPFPADAAGRPVEEVTVHPDTVTVTTRTETMLIEHELQLRVLPLVVDGVSEVSVSHQAVRVIGPPSVLAGLDELVGAIALPTERPDPGRYTLAVNVATPPGVMLGEDVTASVRYEPRGAAR